MTMAIWVTDKIHDRAMEKAQELHVPVEGLVGVILVLALSSETMLRQALGIMKMYGLGGATDMAKKGW